MVKRTIYFAVVSIMVVGTWIVSGCVSRSHEKRAEWMTEKIASRLELNEEQKDLLNGLRDEWIEKGKELHESRAAIRNELVAQLGSDKIDRDRLTEAVKKEEAKLNEAVSELVARLAVFHDSLTPEQRADLVRIVEKWDGRRRVHHHPEG
jgi:Spy/CpxP family protein refolding chaperone